NRRSDGSPTKATTKPISRPATSPSRALRVGLGEEGDPGRRADLTTWPELALALRKSRRLISSWRVERSAVLAGLVGLSWRSLRCREEMAAVSWRLVAFVVRTAISAAKALAIAAASRALPALASTLTNCVLVSTDSDTWLLSV